MNRDKAVSLANETLEIIEQGAYALGNSLFDISSAMNKSREWTCFYEANLEIVPVRNFRTTVIEVTKETTLHAAARIRKKYDRVGVLNFASARNPGGGFLRGALAQEESLARSSTLYAHIKDMPIYEKEKENRKHGEASLIYGSWVIYTPDIVVFRDDEGSLLHHPYTMDVVTCPAPNKAELEKANSPYEKYAEPNIRQRIRLILSAFYHHNLTTLVLGAWGCGIYGNDPVVVASTFKEMLDEDFKGLFKHIVFAIYSGHAEDENYDVFKEVL
jgi:uncharacterized protein (TIGR02452 family)